MLKFRNRNSYTRTPKNWLNPMRARLLILASAIAMLGWGTVLPVPVRVRREHARLGQPCRARPRRAFSPSARWSQPRSAVGWPTASPRSPSPCGAKTVAAVGAASLIWAGSPLTFLAGMFVFGAGHHRGGARRSPSWCCAGSGAAPTAAVSSPGSSPGSRSAWQSAPSPPATWSTSTGPRACGRPSRTAAGGFVLSALMILAAGRGAPAQPAGMAADATAGVSGRRAAGTPCA